LTKHNKYDKIDIEVDHRPMCRLALKTKEVAMDLSDLSPFMFDSTAAAVAATCPAPGEPEFESARRAVVASAYLSENDGVQPRMATLSPDTLGELIANIRKVVSLIDGYVMYQPSHEDHSDNEAELDDEDDILASYGAQLKRFLAQLHELSA
jgi:hypothetical protein